MEKLNNLLIGAKIKAAAMKEGVVEALKSKETGDETLIIKIMLMVVAVVLVILFRDQIYDLIKTLVTSVSEKVQGMYNKS